MTIVFDAHSSGSTGWADSVTQSHTIGAGADRVLVAGCVVYHNADKVTGVTYNGVAMTRVRADASGFYCRVYVYVLANPPTGTHDLVFNFSTSDVSAQCIGASFSGVDQTSPVYASAGYFDEYDDTPTSLAISTPTDGVAISFIGANQDRTYTQGDGQTSITSLARFAASYKADATAMGWSWTGAQSLMAHAAASLSPATASGPTAELAITTAADVFSGSASVPAACSLAITTANDAFSGSASSVTDPYIVTEPLKNNTGTVLASETGVTAHVYEVASGDKVATLTGQTTDASGVMTLSSALFSATTEYRVVVVLGSGAEGMAKYTTQ